MHNVLAFLGMFAVLFSYSCAISQGGRRALGRLAWEVGDVGGKWVTDVRVVIDSGDL